MSNKLLICIIIISVVINVVLPMVVKPFATSDQISPPNGASKLSFIDQIMHMLVHHAQVPISSSIIIVIIVLLSCVLGKKLCTVV